MPELLECGRIINTHGVRGELKIDPWCDSPVLFEQLSCLYIDGTAYPILQSRPHKGFVLCKLEGIDSLDQAMTFKNKVVHLDRSQVELEDGTYFIADIIGFSVYDKRTQQVIGSLEEVRPSPASDLYCIATPQGPVLIPAVPPFVSRVDFENRVLELNTIWGMLPNEN